MSLVLCWNTLWSSLQIERLFCLCAALESELLYAASRQRKCNLITTITLNHRGNKDTQLCVWVCLVTGVLQGLGYFMSHDRTIRSDAEGNDRCRKWTQHVAELWSSLTTQGLMPHKQTAARWRGGGGGFTWRRTHLTLWVGCVWRAPAVRSRRRRSSSCTWPRSSSEDAASATTAPWGSCGCKSSEIRSYTSGKDAPLHECTAKHRLFVFYSQCNRNHHKHA